jgi:hypothetical protein
MHCFRLIARTLGSAHVLGVEDQLQRWRARELKCLRGDCRERWGRGGVGVGKGWEGHGLPD